MNVEFPKDHENPNDSQLLLAITGTPEMIRETLELLIRECYDQGKPIQRTVVGFDSTRSVITPIWKGKKY